MADVVKTGTWVAPTEKEREALPQGYFLGAAKTFPYREWQGADKGKISCPGLRACIARANTSGHSAIGLRASRLYAQNCAEEVSTGE